MARGEIPLTVTRLDVGHVGEPVTTGTATVNIRGGGLASVYPTATGGSPGPNPITIDNVTGRIDGWLDDGSYDVQVAGTGITTYVQPIEIVNGAAINAFDGARVNVGSIAGAALANLAVTGAKIASQTITKDKLEANVVPIGTVILYWRPNNSHPLPTGWLELNGQSVIAANHDFTGGGTITLPDVRNKFPLGADSSKAHGTAGTANNLNTGAPGLTSGGNNSAGGANTINLNHRHSHSHTHDYSHTHRVKDHSHYVPGVDHLHTYSAKFVQGVQNNSGAYGIYNSATTGPADRDLGISSYGVGTGSPSERDTESQSTTTTGAPSDSNTDYQLSSTQDIRPWSYGFIFLMKVKNT